MRIHTAKKPNSFGERPFQLLEFGSSAWNRRHRALRAFSLVVAIASFAMVFASTSHAAEPSQLPQAFSAKIVDTASLTAATTATAASVSSGASSPSTASNAPVVSLLPPPPSASKLDTQAVNSRADPASQEKAKVKRKKPKKLRATTTTAAPGSQEALADVNIVVPTSVVLKSVEPKSVEPKSVEPKSVEPKSVEPKSVVPTSIVPTNIVAKLLKTATLKDPSAKSIELVAAKVDSPDSNLEMAFAALRKCESGGNYRAATGNGYYGAYQFDPRTWRALGYSGLPSEAAAEVQDEAARKLLTKAGWGQWPACSRKLGLR